MIKALLQLPFFVMSFIFHFLGNLCAMTYGGKYDFSRLRKPTRPSSEMQEWIDECDNNKREDGLF